MIRFAVKGGGRGASDGSLVALGSTGTHEVSGEASDPTPRCNPSNGIINAHKHDQVPLEGKRSLNVRFKLSSSHTSTSVS